MKLLLFNQDWFKHEWQSAGHEVLTIGMSSHLDITLNSYFLDIHKILQFLPQGFTPDWIVFHDNSSPLSVTGLSECNIPLAFYSVDTHHHCLLHSYLADLFDLVFVAQKDYLKYFTGRRAIAHWLPLWASRDVEPQINKKYDTIFVGTLNHDLNPDRVLFFEKLQKIAPISVLQGDYANFFPFSKLVINQTVRGDLNFRVFEALRCGPALLTEKSANGLLDLFTPDRDLAVYQKGDVEEAARIIEELHANPQKLLELANNGHKKILDYHCAHHRAKEFLACLESATFSKKHRLSAGLMMNCAVWAANAGREAGIHTIAALTAAMKLILLILERNEELNEESAFFAVIACMAFDKLTTRDSGKKMIGLMAERFPNLRTLGVGQVALLAKGEERLLAEQLSKLIGLPDLAFLDRLFPNLN